MRLSRKIIINIVAISIVTFMPLHAMAEWVDADQSGQESINITNTVEDSATPSLTYNPLTNYPAIAWEEGTIGVAEIYYLQWDGAEWVDADGTGQESANVSNNAGDSFSPSLAFNPSTGFPSIAWADTTGGNADIYFLQWNGFAWVDADGVFQDGINVSNAVGSSLHPKLAYNTTSNYPVITWTDIATGDYEIRYLQWNGSAWVDADGVGQGSIEIVSNAGASTDPTLVMDDNNLPMISWVDNSTGNLEIYFLQWNGSAWVDADGVGQESINISQTAGDNDYDPDIDSLNNRPVIAWNCQVGGSNEICLLQWNGSAWVDVDGTGQGNKNVSNNSGSSQGPKLSINNSNTFLLSWYDNTLGDTDVYFLQWNGSAWVDADGTGQEGVVIFDDSSSSGTISLDYNSDTGYPGIAWRDYNEVITEILFLEWIPDVIPVLSSTNSQGQTPILPETGNDPTIVNYINDFLGLD